MLLCTAYLVFFLLCFWLPSSQITGFFFPNSLAKFCLPSQSISIFNIRLTRHNRFFPVVFVVCAINFGVCTISFDYFSQQDYITLALISPLMQPKIISKQKLKRNFASFIIFMVHLSYYPRWHHQSKWQKSIKAIAIRWCGLWPMN